MLQIVKKTTSNKGKKETSLHAKEWFQGGTMKKQFTSLVLAILFGWLLGCNSNPVQVPDQISNQDSPAGQKMHLLELPAPADVNLAKKYSVASWISADAGGKLEISEQFQNKSGYKTATVTATLSIPENALNEDRYISMQLDDSKLQIKFNPDGLQFNVPAKLSYTVTGLNLSSVPVGTEIKLYYCNRETGMFEEMHSGSITYDIKSGTITCLNAEIPHFSEYAFGYIKKLYEDP
jgi:hypothetical protein